MQRSPLHFTIIGALLTCYLLPLILLILYTGLLVSQQERWQLLSIGLFCSLCGTLTMMVLMRRWEAQLLQSNTGEETSLFGEKQRSGETRYAPSKTQEVANDYLEELEQQKRVFQELFTEKESLQQTCERLEQSFKVQQERFVDQLRAKEMLLEENQQTLADQQALLERRQKQIASLESTARDLKYELKTLIDLTDRIHTVQEPHDDYQMETPALQAHIEPIRTGIRQEVPPVPTQGTEPLNQLKRCIDIAQKLTGARHLTGHVSRFQDQSTDGYALDLRRLCDSLRSESSSGILLYSQKEEKLLFVNNPFKQLLGWGPEKVVQDFSNLIVQGKEEWQSALRRLTPSSPASLMLTFKAKSGDHRHLQLLLGVIPTGIFKTHVVGVVYEDHP